MTLAIVNHENESNTYKVQIRIDAVIVEEVGPIVLAAEKKWEQKVDFVARRIGENQRVEFQLYKGSSEKLNQTLHLWIDVVEEK